MNHVTGSAKKNEDHASCGPGGEYHRIRQAIRRLCEPRHHLERDSSDEDEQDYAQSAERMVAALRLAQDEGMKVVLISNSLQGTFRMPS